MAADRIDASEQIPEADLLEQQTPLDPQSLTDAERLAMIAGSHPSEVNEADRMEQNTPVLGPDEDDYPHEAPR